MRKRVPKSAVSKRKPVRKRSFLRPLYWSILLFFILIFAAAYHYRNGIAYYFSFKTDKIVRAEKAEEKRLNDVRNYQLLTKYQEKSIGFDVSHYQGEIDWNKVKYVENTFPLQFVFIRATAGKDVVDACFSYNWKESRRIKMMRGAYHYYRPNENSLEQAANFIKTVKLRKGDLPPVLDIEKLPEEQSLDSLKVGLRRWLEKVDSHYKVKPIIYTGEKYYNAFLKEEFSEYRFWIANYNFFVEDIKEDWLFWQFTEKATVKGIPRSVDVNIYNGTPKMLQYMTIN